MKRPASAQWQRPPRAKPKPAQGPPRCVWVHESNAAEMSATLGGQVLAGPAPQGLEEMVSIAFEYTGAGLLMRLRSATLGLLAVARLEVAQLAALLEVAILAALLATAAVAVGQPTAAAGLLRALAVDQLRLAVDLQRAMVVDRLSARATAVDLHRAFRQKRAPPEVPRPRRGSGGGGGGGGGDNRRQRRSSGSDRDGDQPGDDEDLK